MYRNKKGLSISLIHWLNSLMFFSLLFFCTSSLAFVNQRIVLIEGIGGALSANHLGPAILNLKAMHQPDVKVVFYGTDLNFSELPERGQKIIRALQDDGMVFLYKSKPEDMLVYNSVRPDYVFLSTPPDTHVKLAKEWVSRKVTPKAVIVEKPFSEDLTEMEDFVKYLNENPSLKNKVYAFDFAETVFSLHEKRLKQVNTYLGGIQKITLFWLQNNSGEIINEPKLLSHDDRPISRENRVNLLQNGMVFDELVHLFPAIHKIVDIKTAQITDIKAAQYENAEIKGETFVAARFLMKSKLDSHNIPVAVYAGKGIGKIESLKVHRNKMHILLLHGKNGKTVMLSMDELMGRYLDENGLTIQEFDLPKKYVPVINNLFLQKAEMGQSVEEALDNIKLATHVKKIINEYEKIYKQTTYTVGTAKTPAPSVEDVLRNSPSIYSLKEDNLNL